MSLGLAGSAGAAQRQVWHAWNPGAHMWQTELLPKLPSGLDMHTCTQTQHWPPPHTQACTSARTQI